MPSTSPFDDLIRKRANEMRADAARNSVDWDERRMWWPGRVGQLYDEVRAWFKPLTDDAVVSITTEVMSVREETLGVYEISKLIISLGGQSLELVPVASVIVGGFGRIDLNGPAGRAMLVLAPRDVNSSMPERRNSSQWYLAPMESRTKLTMLSEEVFKQVFSDLMSLSS